MREYFQAFDLDIKAIALLTRMVCGFNPKRLRAADYFVRYPFSSVEAIEAGLEHLAEYGLVAAQGEDRYALTALGERLVRGWMRVVESRVEALDLGAITSADVERLLAYDRRILGAIRAASRPHGQPIFTLRMQGMHPSYEPPALWHHWLYIWSMLAASEDEEEHVRKLRGMDPMVWFVRRQIWLVHRRPWRARVKTLDDLVSRATGYSPMNQAEAACARAVQELESRGWVEVVDGAYRLTGTGLVACDEDERQVDAHLVSTWPNFEDDERIELFDLATRFNNHLKDLISNT
jgi:Mn-dependent DtxR family transcriptional regulator